MIMMFNICLIGSIPKGDDIRKDWIDWKTQYKIVLSKLDNVKFIDGDNWKDETKPFLLFGHDSNLIKTSDLVIVNAENKLGAGTAQEMVIAKYFTKPVITILPKDTHHRRSNIIFDGTLIDDWIHPFLFSMSDQVVENIEDSVSLIKEYMTGLSNRKIKDITIIDEAITAYLEYSNKDIN